jgi:hypothetical protein
VVAGFRIKNDAKTKDPKQPFVGEAGNVCLGKPTTTARFRHGFRRAECRVLLREKARPALSYTPQEFSAAGTLAA